MFVRIRRLLNVIPSVDLDTNSLLGEKVNEQLVGSGVNTRLSGVSVLMDLSKVLVEKNGGVKRTALGLRMELSGEDGLLDVDHTLVRLIVEVDEVRLELGGQSVDVNSVTVVLRSDVALASGQVESRDVMGSVTVLKLDSLGSSSKGEELVAKADTEDGQIHKLGLLVHDLSKVENGGLAVSGVTRAVGDKDTVKVMGNILDGVVKGEDGNGGTSRDQRSENVLLNTTVHHGDVQRVLDISGSRHVEGLLGGDSSDEVDLTRVNKGGVLIGVVLLADSDLTERRALLSEVGDNGSSVDTGDGGNTLTLAPLAKRLDGGPVRVLESGVGDDDTDALDVGGLKVLDEAKGVGLLAGGDTVVADERLGEDQDLASVRGISHGLGVADHSSGEDGLAGDDSVGTERSTGEDGSVLEGEGGRSSGGGCCSGGSSGHESAVKRSGSGNRSGHRGQSSDVLEHVCWLLGGLVVEEKLRDFR